MRNHSRDGPSSRRPTLIRAAAIAACLLVVFLTGVLVGTKQYPPYDQLRDVKQAFFGGGDSGDDEEGPSDPTVQSLPVRAEPIGSFRAPVFVASAPAGPEILFVVEKRGTIAAIEDTSERPVRFLDISPLVGKPGDTPAEAVGIGGEAGLLSMAFAPDYAESRLFYVVFVNRAGDVEVDEFRTSRRSPPRAVPSSRREVLRIDHSQGQNHYGGQLEFGPDGYLYIGTGDGGYPADVSEPSDSEALRLSVARFKIAVNAADTRTLLGKLLRIDPRPKGNRPYGIPSDNPFVGRPGRDEIYSYGLRNPWRFSFHDQLLAVADVGETLREEINVLPLREARGANFGWPHFEGNVEFAVGVPTPEPLIPPDLEVERSDCAAIIGGYVVDDASLPALSQRYVFGDYCDGVVRTLRINGDTADDLRPTDLTIPSLSSFGKDRDGQLYATSLSGRVYRVVEARSE